MATYIKFSEDTIFQGISITAGSVFELVTTDKKIPDPKKEYTVEEVQKYLESLSDLKSINYEFEPVDPSIKDYPRIVIHFPIKIDKDKIIFDDGFTKVSCTKVTITQNDTLQLNSGIKGNGVKV